MAVAYVSVGTVGTGTTSATPGLPASLATGDGVLLAVVVKPDTATIVTPTGWTLVSNVAGGGGTVGNGTGPQRSATFFREKDAGWSTMPAVAVTGGTSSAAMASRWTKGSGESWDVAAATGVYGTAATTTNATTTMGSNPGITTGDMLAMFVTNQSATPTWSAQSFTATGATIGAATERSEAIEFATSPQVGGMLATASVTAGTASANPVANATASAATRGTSTIVRLRGVAQPPFPVADASSPATVKTLGTGAISSASFTPPANACIVVGLTSDADNASGTTPTITDSSGGRFTWTRVTSLGHGGTGDVGLVVLFQGVPTSPGTSPGAMTVTVTPNNTGTNKPRMLRTSVYTSTTVDINDPIGAFAAAAFSGSNPVTGSVTPETTGGGIRMMWLDWSARDTPTAYQANTVLADIYHNAGLSTNVQLGKINATVTGVSETVGGTLSSASSDGNWIVYELRAPAAGGGSTDHPLAGSVAATTTTTGTPLARVALAGAVAAVTAVTGTIGVSQSLSGTVAGTSSTAGSIGVAQGLGGTVAATATAVGAITAHHPLGGTVTATTATTGAPVAHHPLAGSVAATTAASGSLTLRAPLTGTIAATSTTSGTPTSRQGLAGTVNAVTSTAGTLYEAGAQVYPLSGNVTATTTTSGSITARHPLSGTVAAASTAVGSIARAASLAGSVTGTTVVLGTVTATVTLSGQVTATSSTTGGFIGADLPEVELVVGTMQPARFTAGPPLPTPTATADAPRIVSGTPLPPRYTRRT